MRRWSGVVAFVFSVGALVSCVTERDKGHDSAPVQRSHTAPPRASVADSALAAPPGLDATALDAASDVSDDAGNWTRCYAHFSPRGEPKLEAMRLGLMCGPSNGMKKLVDQEEELLPGETKEHRLIAQAYDCFRIFAVASAELKNLDIEVNDARGTRIAADDTSARFVVLNAAEPICPAEAGELRVRVRGENVAGITRGQEKARATVALQVWRLSRR